MKQKDILELSDKQLQERIAEEQLSLTRMRLAHGISAIENPMNMVKTRKLIARLKTELRGRQVAAASKTE